MTDQERDALLLEIREDQRTMHGKVDALSGKVDRIEQTVNEVDDRVSDIAQVLRDMGYEVDPPDEATG